MRIIRSLQAIGFGLACYAALPAVAAAESPDSRPFVIVLPVDINAASGLMLQRSMVGVGPKKAAAIIDYRTRMGRFEDVKDMLRVPGIGPGTLRKNLGRITVVTE